MAKCILGMGNPLLDMSADVDQAFLDKYELKTNNAILAEEKQMPLYAEMAKMSGVVYVAGGATQNSIRVAQKMLDGASESNKTHYIGCVGDDEQGKTMAQCCADNGVATHYRVDTETPTGVCAVGIYQKERTLCTKLEAANKYNAEHFAEEAQQTVLKTCDIVYSSGFFLTVCPDAMVTASTHCKEAGKTYCLNLAAPFIMEVPPFKAAMEKVLPNTNIVFGNESEAAVFKTQFGLECGDDIPAIAAAMQKKFGNDMVIITQGKDPTVVATANGVDQYAVTPVEEDKIVDTNGAGDAFVGGFLAGLALGKTVADCCKAGNISAGEIICQSGCAWSPTWSFDWNTCEGRGAGC